jgi:hypothetical protein
MEHTKIIKIVDYPDRVWTVVVMLLGVLSWDYMTTMAAVKGMLHNPNQYTDLLMIHRRIHTQSEMHWSNTLLKLHLLHNLIVFGSSII